MKVAGEVSCEIQQHGHYNYGQSNKIIFIKNTCLNFKHVTA